MKKITTILSLVLLVTLLLSGCLDNVMVIPDNDSIGESKTFEKAGLRLTLTDQFAEQHNDLGFDAYYVSDFCYVSVLKEGFHLEKGLGEKDLEAYTRGVIASNGHTDIEPQNRDGLWYYVITSGNYTHYCYCYKGSNAFYIVQFICKSEAVDTYEDLFYLWASSVEITDTAEPIPYPDNNFVGESKTFEKVGLRLTLTDQFTEQKSERGFDAYYTSDFCGVVVLKEEFYMDKSMAEEDVEEYTRSVIENNGRAGIEPQNQDGLWFYTAESGASMLYSFSYKGQDAFYIVQFMCMSRDVHLYEDLIFQWAKAVEITDISK